MMPPPEDAFHVAIACGGTGGHLFPGLAVAEQLAQRGCKISLLISPKEVDQQAVKNVRGMEIVTLPAVALQNRNYLSFVRGCFRSYRAARRYFKSHPPQAVLAMGGFTSAPPVLAAKFLGAKTFLHESNTIPGRGVRWFSPSGIPTPHPQIRRDWFACSSAIYRSG
jgi:UDP-N-acetylglucosamine--N-acetylmuramyl-(pentapeptide) pyrophosphoryl-undecaprenol N-acetylglucosamine transferase